MPTADIKSQAIRPDHIKKAAQAVDARRCSARHRACAAEQGLRTVGPNIDEGGVDGEELGLDLDSNGINLEETRGDLD